jgi:RNA polymerase sigma-54 factor
VGLSGGLRLEVRQSQGLVITPQLQQAIKLLQMSNLELAGVVDRELAENPFLERREAAPATARLNGAEPALDGRPGLRPEPAPGREDDGEWRAPPLGGPGLRIDGGRGPRSDFSSDERSLEERLARPPSLRDHLREQLALEAWPARRTALVAALIESIDDDGYLRDPPDELCARLGCSPVALDDAIRALQGFDPTGVGARDLRECLALQLAERDRLDPLMQRLLDHLPMLARADLPGLLRVCGTDAEDLQDMVAELKRLDPRPGSRFAPSGDDTVIPDVSIRPIGEGRWRIELNQATLPKVLVRGDYHATLSQRAVDRKEREYLSERLQSANWLVKALDQRARTLVKVTRAIFARQREFLTHGPARLRPLVLRDIAAATGLHESTVSRATSEKYVETPRGTFPLKYFFTAAIQGSDGEGAHGAEAIRQRIRVMIEREGDRDALSDDQIVAALGREGVVIARRTVAKYRESLGIASSVQRRRQKLLQGTPA